MRELSTVLWTTYCSSSSHDDQLSAEKEITELFPRIAEYEGRDHRISGHGGGASVRPREHVPVGTVGHALLSPRPATEHVDASPYTAFVGISINRSIRR